MKHLNLYEGVLNVQVEYLFIKILIVCTELSLKAKTRLGDKNEFYHGNIPLTGKKLGSHMMQSF